MGATSSFSRLLSTSCSPPSLGPLSVSLCAICFLHSSVGLGEKTRQWPPTQAFPCLLLHKDILQVAVMVSYASLIKHRQRHCLGPHAAVASRVGGRVAGCSGTSSGSCSCGHGAGQRGEQRASLSCESVGWFRRFPA